MKPFRFGLQAFNPKSPAAWREMLGKVEDLGYSAYHLADHFMGPGPAQESTAHPPQILAAVPAMAMALEYTKRIKVGARVFCMDYRDPVILAKEAATMDYLSDGRLELGLGAGWIQAEYEAAGMDFRPIGERLDKFENVVSAVKAFMSGEPLSIDNDHIHWQGFSDREEDRLDSRRCRRALRRPGTGDRSLPDLRHRSPAADGGGHRRAHGPVGG